VRTVIVADFSSDDGLHVNPLAPQLIRSRAVASNRRLWIGRHCGV